jgi:hypothetical protein
LSVTGDLTVDTNTLYVDSTNNLVGIGQSSPDAELHIGNGSGASDNTRLRLTGGTSGQSTIQFGDTASANIGQIQYDHSNNGLVLRVNAGTRATITSAGQLLIGRTATSGVADGHRFDANGFTQHVRDGGSVLELSRETSSGDIQVFKQGTTTVGSIGANGGGIFLEGPNYGFRIRGTGDKIFPSFNGGAVRDNLIDWGTSDARWDDIYATNGTIQTSDANEKQQIAALTDAEITAAKAISALFKTFKWNDSVAEKGDAARTHAGVIAQDVEAAMTAAGLDAGDYAFFISTTWWETQTEVPAVEAVDAVLDEEGNVVTEAVEAVAAYTRTDTYDTAEEAPEGATERNRKGIRYPELLAFVGAATEQRLANIETRLAALEAN